MDLTLINCNIQFGEKAWINIGPGRTLTLENCTLDVCSTEMWRGIVLDKKGGTNSPKVHLKDCIINNAELATYLTRDAIYQLEGCTFYDNYKDVLIENYPTTVTTAMQSNGEYTISGCLFTSNGGNLMSPYNASHKFAAIELNDVESIVIGKSSSGSITNEISNSLFGIKSTNSSFKCLNNEFHDIWDNSTTPTTGSCIYAESSFDYSDRSIDIGNGSSQAKNIFLKSFNAITGIGEMNYEILENDFGSTDNSERIRENCIYIHDFGKKQVIIGNQSSTGTALSNNFYQYNHGIQISAPNRYGKLLIRRNKFYNGVFDPGPVNFEGTAISVFGFHPVPLLDAEISANTIGESGSSSSDQPRIGIRLSVADQVRVIDNKIYFHQSGVPSEHYRGIWTKGCRYLQLNGNLIEDVSGFTSGTDDFLTGMRIDDSYSTCIEENTLNGLGNSISFSGNSVVHSLFKNKFDEFDNGIFLNTANIGARVGSEDPSSPGDGNVMDNKWYLCSGCANTSRITGSIINAGISWYTPTSITTDIQYPASSANFVFIRTLLGSVNSISECPLPLFYVEDDEIPIALKVRNDNYGGIVADTSRYPEEHENEFRYSARQMVYGILKRTPNLLNFDDPSDTSFSNFYSALHSSNINKIDSLEKLMEKDSFLAADNLLDNFTDTNDIEYNYKKVYRYYVKMKLYGDTSITDAERDEVMAIAYEHPLIGGGAVYVARNLFNLEINDDPFSSSRVFISHNTQHVVKSLLVYPNPAHEFVSVKLNTGEIPEQLTVMDFTGRLCLMANNTTVLNTAALTSGIYFVKVLFKSEVFKASFIINR